MTFTLEIDDRPAKSRCNDQFPRFCTPASEPFLLSRFNDASSCLLECSRNSRRGRYRRVPLRDGWLRRPISTG